MDIYTLYRNFWDWAFENPEKIKPNHIAIYSFAIEHCNRLGWKRKYGFPTSMVMDAIGIKNYRTYIKSLNDLVEWGFIEMIEKSKNQYSANIIALVNFTKATDKALDKASIKHSTKQGQSTVESIDSIDKQVYNTTKETNIQRDSALDFILETSLFETFAMQNKSQVYEWQNMLDAFNDTMDIELSKNKIQFKTDQLIPRLRKFCRSWISNQKPKESDKPKQTAEQIKAEMNKSIRL
jgi:formaldehyde-activating enzyme involved in methanogenesis